MLSIIFLGLSLYRLPRAYDHKHMDFPRTKYFVEKMITRSNGMPFSFAMFSSKSFNDIHYRFYFHINKINPEHYVTGSYNQLFLICEQSQCPDAQNLFTAELRVMCFDAMCELEYPRIDLKEWNYSGEEHYQNSVLYQFKRN